ncbi:MAG TPA: hypothetical protein VGG39_27810 [Polyangiaceae bacterium]|jgi:hypothetical protein
MKLSRSLFLALTGALATGACHVYVDDPQPPPPPPRRLAYAYPPAPPAPPATYSPSSAAAETNYYNAPRPAPPRIVRRPARRVGVATQDPGYRPPPPNFGLLSPASESSGAIVAPPASPTAPTPAVPSPPATEGCLDTESSAVPDCNEVRVAASCGIRSFVQQECRTYKTYMDAKVAAVAVGCMANLSPAQLCDASNTYACGKQALSEACADNELTQLCQIAAKSCRTTPGDCTALLSGLSDDGKTKVAECISHGCQAGLYSCVEGLR